MYSFPRDKHLRLLGVYIRGIVPHLVPGGVSFLQYANNTILLVEGIEMDIINLKFLLLCFQEMFWLTINFNKSEVMVLGYSENFRQSIAARLNCWLGSFPTSYLGVPIVRWWRRSNLESSLGKIGVFPRRQGQF